MTLPFGARLTRAAISETMTPMLFARVEPNAQPLRRAFSLAATTVLASSVLLLCGCSGVSKVPGIDLGAPDITWVDKNQEQRFGFMAARVHPGMQAVFAEYDDSYADDFTCQTCHGLDPERVDYKMPSEDLYPLPRDNAIGATMEDDPEVGNFMMGKVVPSLQTMFSEGHGGATKVNCFTCHPAED
jgi:hypothetical protein